MKIQLLTVHARIKIVQDKSRRPTFWDNPVLFSLYCIYICILVLSLILLDICVIVPGEDNGSWAIASSWPNRSMKFVVVAERTCFLGNLFRTFFFFPAVAMGSEDLVRVSAEFRSIDNDFLRLRNWSNDLRNSATAMECWHILNALYRGQSSQNTFPVLCWYIK